MKLTTLSLIIGLEMARGAGALPDFGERIQHSTRQMTVVSIDENERTVELAFSSEAEVEQWFGIEILDHSPGAVDMSRLNDGAPLLVDHNWRDQAGVVKVARIDEDRIGRAFVKFSRSQRGEEIFQDVKDNIRTKVSVGYKIIDAKITETRDGGNTDVITVTRWLPYEISFVSVPADNSVGVGRSVPIDSPHMDPKENTADNPAHTPHPVKGKRNMNLVEKTVRDARGNLVRAMVDTDNNDRIESILYLVGGVPELEGGERGQQRQHRQQNKGANGDDDSDPAPSRADIEGEIKERNAEIFAMGETYGLQSVAAKAVGEGKTVDQARAMLLDAMNERGEKHPGSIDGNGSRSFTAKGAKAKRESGKPIDENATIIGMSEREIGQWSLFRAIRALDKPNDARVQREAAFEIQCSEAAAEAYGREAQGLMIPEDVLRNFAGGQMRAAAQRALNAGGAPDTPPGAITGQNIVAENYLASEFIGMLRNNTVLMGLARTMTGLTGNIAIPKQTGGAQAFWVGEGENVKETIPTFGQIKLSPHTVGAYTDITRRLLKQSTPDAENLVRADLAAAVGIAIDYAGFYGTGTGDEPRGIKNYTGIGATEWAGNFMSYQEAVALESEIAADNALVDRMAYVFDARGRGAAKTTPKFMEGQSVGQAGLLWEPNGTVNGYRAAVTNQIKTGDAFFGNFNDFIIAMWGGLDLTIDPYALSLSGGLRIVVMQDLDFGMRRVESFAYGTKKASA